MLTSCSLTRPDSVLANSADVQLAAINALYNSLEFVRENFGREVSES